MGAQERWQISVSSSQFCCEPKTSLKEVKSLLKKKKEWRFIWISLSNILNISVWLIENYLRDWFIYMKNGITYPVYSNKILKIS